MNTSEIIKWEPMHTSKDWEVHFNMDWWKKQQERQKYDAVWEMIKEKNNW